MIDKNCELDEIKEMQEDSINPVGKIAKLRKENSRLKEIIDRELPGTLYASKEWDCG
jgi:hypothetical protein